MTSPSPTDFAAALRGSGLLSEEALAPYLTDELASPAQVANRLVRDGLLTPFQASCLLAGRARGFFLARRYKVLRPLGAGGMGQVFLAEQAGLRRQVALKVLPARFAADPVAMARFDREARAAAALDHPNVVRVHDTGEDGGVHFLVMEYVAGISLHDLVTGCGALPVPAACDYVRQAALGLAHAHGLGLVHRDIKPANLLVDRDGVVKVLDLGLARFVAADGDDGLTRRHNANDVLGTADYMAPEQAVSCSEAGPAADQYALGCTLHFLLAGKAPFAGLRGAHKLMAHQARRPEPPPGLPPGLQEVLDRLMAKSPADRFPSAADVAVALVPWAVRTPPDVAGAAGSGPPPTDRMTAGGTLDPRTGYVSSGGGEGALVELEDAAGEAARAKACHAADRPVLLWLAGLAAAIALTAGGIWVAAGVRATPAPVAASAPDSDSLPDHARLVRLEARPHAQFLTAVAALPPREQSAAVLKRLKRLNPSLDDAYTDSVEDGRVTRLEFNGRGLADLSPVAALTGLRELACSVEPWDGNSTLTSVAPLRGLPLRRLELGRHHELKDITALAGMPLERLNLSATAVDDYSPLAGMNSLRSLDVSGTPAKDLGPVAGLPLDSLSLQGKRGVDFGQLRGMPLHWLSVAWTDFRDASVLAGMPLESLHAERSDLADLSPLAGLPLKELNAPPAALAASEPVVRGLSRLEKVGGLPPPLAFRWARPEPTEGLLFRDDFRAGKPTGWKDAPAPWRVRGHDGRDHALICPSEAAPGLGCEAGEAEWADYEVAAWVHLGPTKGKPLLFARQTRDDKGFRRYTLCLDVSGDDNLWWGIAADDGNWRAIVEGTIQRPRCKWLRVRFRLERDDLSAAVSEDGVHYRHLGAGKHDGFKNGTVGVGRYEPHEVAFDGFAVYPPPKGR